MGVNEFTELGGRLLVIFDGHCGLCNRSVRWFLRRDRRDRMRFVASESPLVAEILERHDLGPAQAREAQMGPTSIVVVQDAGSANEKALVRSQAVLAMMNELPRPWPGFAAILRWVPRTVRDLGYRAIARVRYRVWGRVESCPLPTAEERTRLL
jgi:predicted DCC family thiol-disulfide oxidoreductase YuxK